MPFDSAAPALPDELMPRVARHVDLQQRLGSCSLVCKAWREGAAAATSDIRITTTDRHSGGRRLRALQQWLSAHSMYLKQLNVLGSGAVRDKLQLPLTKLPQLQQLTVHDCLLEQPADSSNGSSSNSAANPLHVQLQPQPAHAGTSSDGQYSASGNTSTCSSQLPLASLSSLTALDLTLVTYALTGGISGLSVLTGLQRLSLCDVEVGLAPGIPRAQQLQHPSPQQPGQQQTQQQQQLNWLSPLTGLTQLDIAPWLLPPGVVGPFSSLRQLQQLDLPSGHGRCVGTTAAMLSGLPLSITKLTVAWDDAQDLSSSSVPAMCGLIALRELRLATWHGGVAIVSDFCSSMAQLRLLSVEAGDCVHRTGAALVDVLLRLPQLQNLRLNADTEGSLTSSEVHRLGALLPRCSHLTRLELSWEQSGTSWSMLPAECGRRLFASGQQLLQLKQLALGVPSDVDAMCHPAADFETGIAYDVGYVASCFGIDDIDRLVRCCPALELLHIAGLVQPDVDMRPLLQLAALTELVVGGDMVDDDLARSVLAQLSGLRRLGVYAAPQLTVNGLLALAALKQLRRFGAGRHFGPVSPFRDGCIFLACALATTCMHSNDRACRSRAASLLKVRQGTQQLQEQLAAQNQYAAAESHAFELAQQLAAAQAQVKSLAQQLAAAQAELAAVQKDGGSDELT